MYFDKGTRFCLNINANRTLPVTQYSKAYEIKHLNRFEMET